MNSIFKNELKLSRKSLIIWCIVLMITTLYSIVEYPTVAQNTDLIMESMEALPRIVVIMFGLEGVGLQTSLDYHLALFYWISLIAYFHAIITGVTVLARDERDKTAEYIYTKPYKRSDILSAKLMAGLVNIAILAFITWICSIATITYIDGTLSTYINGKSVFSMVSATIVGMFLTQLIFYAVGLLLAGFFKTYKKALRYGYLFVIVSYVLGVAIQYSGNLNVLKPLSLFSYFIGLSVVTNGLETRFVILAIIVSLISFYGSYRAYGSKDLVI